MPKLDMKSILGIASIVQSLVQTAQSLKGKSGPEKHEIVVAQAKEILPAVEGIAGRDIVDNDRYEAALDHLIALEKAVLVARADVAAIIADAKAKAAKQD